MKKYGFLVLVLLHLLGSAQSYRITGVIKNQNKAVENATIGLLHTSYGTFSDEEGKFLIKSRDTGNYVLHVTSLGYEAFDTLLHITVDSTFLWLSLVKKENENSLDEVVITGTLKETTKLESPVPVEVYNPTFFRKNPSSNIFDALQNVNGVRPQLNCNVCNTGDIHINGMEGPYTMVLLDGMPIVSGLSTVYGLSGIPMGLIDRVEIIKGPAASLYGSEAVAGLINIVTKNPMFAPRLTADVYTTSWLEHNVDLGVKVNSGKKANSLLGVNYYNYTRPVDNNHDGFTDLTLQHRISVFNKWSFVRKANRLASVAGRYFYEDRWGGQTTWNRSFRGGDSIYGESIFTSRTELLGTYQLPLKEKIIFNASFNRHEQDSRYGKIPYLATQQIAFGQFTWFKNIGTKNEFTAGVATRYTLYDDNTPATYSADSLHPFNKPDKTVLPGVFVQNEWNITSAHKLLTGFRYDYNSIHGNIYTPRIAYKASFKNENILRVNAGTGYRVVNLFTEEHAALTGARTVEVKGALRPEQSWNVNVNYIKRWIKAKGIFQLDATLFHTRFTNKIIADYTTNANKIIYDNLAGYAVSQGLTLNTEFAFVFPLKIIAGITLLDVYSMQNANGSLSRKDLLFTEKYTGTWSVTYKINKYNLSIDYTGNLYGPMKLPLLGPLDPRSAYSKLYSLQNIQVTKSFQNNFDLYGGIKNLLNFTPPKNSIARSTDPFDKRVVFGSDGNPVATADNPYALTFDPSYVYAPNQGIRFFIGIRYKLN
ncbi:MAG: TonB-dependent receptor [Bacteroidia bacterium]